MSSIEPEAREFLRKIAWSVFYGIVWMMANMTFGLYYGLFFPDDGLHISNLLFYLFFFVSIFFLIRYYYRTWNKKYPHG